MKRSWKIDNGRTSADGDEDEDGGDGDGDNRGATGCWTR